jgi:hypothetical protein
VEGGTNTFVAFAVTTQKIGKDRLEISQSFAIRAVLQIKQ